MSWSTKWNQTPSVEEPEAILIEEQILALSQRIETMNSNYNAQFESFQKE